ncbi:MAG: helicase-associated domain-containing protein [Planctomycetota bacterium]
MGAPARPLIVQSDRSLLLEVDSPNFAEVRDGLARFAEIEKSPEHFHTYRLSPISLWNAAAAKMSADEVVGFLESFSRYPVPDNIAEEIRESMGRYGRLQLSRQDGELVLTAAEPELMARLRRISSTKRLLERPVDERRSIVSDANRGEIKHALIKIGYPVEDFAGYVDGAPLAVELAEQLPSGDAFALRPYQKAAADVFHAGGTAAGGTGVVVLPCGAGKTVVGIGVMQRIQMHTLILTTNIVAVRQWKRELLEKTSLTPEQVGEYTGRRKEIRPVTVTTYQILTYRRRRTDEFTHFGLFASNDWGLVIYDEVHLLPAPVFRVTAEIQARRRLGLTATLVREDDKEDEVFSLIGPKRYAVPWRDLERKGWIATARCVEVRVPLGTDDALRYAGADARSQFRIAAENPEKLRVIRQLLEKHAGDSVLVIGQYLRQLQQLSRALEAPLITGQTPVAERERLYAAFRSSEIQLLLVSKVGNFAIDLPDASVAIQVSGTFGSRQEEAQRLGRILRPKTFDNTATFYTLVSQETRDQEFGTRRQLFLTEQGYSYEILNAGDLVYL